VVVGERADIVGRDRADHSVWLQSLRIGAIVGILGFGGVALTGDMQAKLMFDQQPMKMAAAEAACHDGTSFSILALGDVGAQDCSQVVSVIEVPGILSFLAHGDFDTEIKGVNTLVPEYQEKYGTHLEDGTEINYVPVMAVTYWGFRLMILFGALAAFAAVVALWLTRKGTVPQSKWIMRLALLGILAPFAANSAGWIFTEMGRQPFVVAPNPNPSGVDGVFMFTAAAVSPTATVGELLFSLISLTLVYGALLVVEVVLLVKFVRGGWRSAMPVVEAKRDDTDPDDTGRDDTDDDVLTFAY
jgi:cytochrome d ubiquinol oxidase subunit I